MPVTPLAETLRADGAVLGVRDDWTVAVEYADEPDEGPRIADRSARGLVLVHGRDAERLLQGLVTNDVEALEPGDGAYALVLTPKGRPLLDLAIGRTAPDAFLLASEAAAHDSLVATLRRYRLAAKAAIDDARERWAVLAPVGAPAEAADGELVLPGLLGDELAVPAGEAPARWQALRAAGAAPLGADAFEVLRILEGAPRHGADFDEGVLPAEAGLVERAVSFTKGCYVGQEPVARLHWRGHANRLLRRLRLDAPVERDAELVLDGRPVGRVTSVTGLPDGSAAALGYVRREVPDGASLTAGDGVCARLVAPRP